LQHCVLTNIKRKTPLVERKNIALPQKTTFTKYTISKKSPLARKAIVYGL
jgi:hypothetical protein